MFSAWFSFSASFSVFLIRFPLYFAKNLFLTKSNWVTLWLWLCFPRSWLNFEDNQIKHFRNTEHGSGECCSLTLAISAPRIPSGVAPWWFSMQECRSENTSYLQTSLPQNPAASSFLHPRSSFLSGDRSERHCGFSVQILHFITFLPSSHCLAPNQSRQQSPIAILLSFSHNRFQKHILDLGATEHRTISYLQNCCGHVYALQFNMAANQSLCLDS